MSKFPAARFGLFFLLLVGMGGKANAESDVVSYQLKSEAIVHGPKIVVGDLLEPVAKGALATISLGRLGQPGSSQIFTRDKVQSRIIRVLGNLAPVIGGTSCEVKASAQVLDGNELVEFGERYLHERLAALTETARISIERGPAPKNRSVPARQVILEIQPPMNPNFRGNVVLTVVASQDDSEGKPYQVAMVPLSFKIHIEEQQVVSTRLIRRGDLLNGDNTSLVWRDTTHERDPGFTDYAEIDGLKARLHIEPNKVLNRKMVALPPLVNKGDQVWLIVQSRGIRIEARAIAREDGYKDEMILVEVTGEGRENKRKVQAKVVDAGTVVTVAR